MPLEPGAQVPGIPVTALNWQDPPVNRWAFWHVREILPAYRVPRGDGPARVLTYDPAVPAPVILITYATTEDAVRRALNAIKGEGVIAGQPQVIRIEKN